MNIRKYIYTFLFLAVSLTMAAKDFPKSYYFQRADEAFKQEKYDEVLRISQLGVKDNPKDGYCWALISEICAKRAYGRYAEALEAADQALRYINKSDVQWRAFVIGIKGDVYYKIGEYAASKDAYAQAVAIYPDNNDFRVSYADVCYELGDYEEGVRAYEQVAETDPTIVYVFSELAKGYYHLGRFDDARLACKMTHLLSGDNNYDSHYIMARMALDEGKWAPACRETARGLFIENNRNYDVADTLVQLCRPMLDAAMLNELDKVKTDPKAQMLIANYYFHFDDYVHLLYHVHKAEQYGEPRLSAVQGYEVAYYYLGENAEAVKYIEERIAADSLDHTAYYCRQKADYFRSDGQADKALENSLRVLQSPDRSNDDAYRMAGRAYIMLGDLTNALLYMDSAVMTAEERMMPTALFNRGEVYRRIGNEEAAVRDFREALSYQNEKNADRSTFVYVHALLGEREPVEHFADSIDNIPSPVRRLANYGDVVAVYALLHDKQKTLEYLEKYFGLGYRNVGEMRHYFRLDWLRDDPDFQALLGKWEAVRLSDLQEARELMDESDSSDSSDVTELPFTMEGGVCQVKCVINGLPLFFVFDTGAAEVSISSVEANFMLKNGYLTDADFLGKQNYVTATGEIHEGTVINLREVRVGDIVLKDVKASVVKSQHAPLLLGQSVFRRFGTLEVDNQAHIIRFVKK